MNIDRLNKLANYLDTIETDTLNMMCWAEPGFENNECETAACALGHATRVFPELKLTKHESSILYVINVENGLKSIDAACEFFDIIYDVAISIFYDHFYSHSTITPQLVAERIRGIIRGECYY